MKPEQILKKAIEKAIENGYKPDGMLGAVLSGELGIGLDPNIYNHLVADRQYLIYIFSHDFAKAFWGEEIESGVANLEAYTRSGDDGTESALAFEELKSWEFHLQQMAVEEDRLKYIEKFL